MSPFKPRFSGFFAICQQQQGAAVMLISHDIGAIASISQRIAVFYAGGIVEMGPAEPVLRRAAMPYTRALLNALPQAGKSRLEAIGGLPPDFADLPPGCPFRPRCPLAFEKCAQAPPLAAVEPTHLSACWRAPEVGSLPQGAALATVENVVGSGAGQ